MPGASQLPSCIALRSQSNGCYLRYVHEHGETYRQLQLNAKDTINPYARYDVQVSRRHDGLVHIRCRYNRKYWVARRRGDAWCVAADADAPEEDLSSANCTLIQPIIATTDDDDDESVMTVRFVAAGAGDKRKVTRRIVMTAGDDSAAAPCMRVVEVEVEAAAATAAGEVDELGDAFTVFNLVNSERVLPRLVRFKGDNDKFLAYRMINSRRALQFAVTDIGDGSARFQLYPRDDGTSFRVASNNPSQGLSSPFWNVSAANFVTADMLASVANTNRAAWFRIHQVGDAFAIRSVASNRFCKRLTTQDFTDCLNAADATITSWARLAVEEAILRRDIHSISYRLDEARVYDTTVLTMATTVAVNDTSTENVKRMRLVFEDEEKSTWDASLELKLGYTSTIRAGFPKLGLGAQVNISAEFYGEYNWGKTMEKKVRHEVEYEAAVPPRTKVTVKAIATRGVFDVPFDYVQRDVHIDGYVLQNTKNDGLFTGINGYNFSFETIEEKLSERLTTVTAAA